MYKKVKQSSRFRRLNSANLSATATKRVCQLQENEYFIMNGIEYVVERIDEIERRLYYKSSISSNKAVESLGANSKMKVYII